MPGKPPRPLLSTRRRGDLAESMFVTECLRRGFTVARPFGEPEDFDFLVLAGGRLSRVQVKSCWSRRRSRSYGFHAARRVARLKIDFVAAYAACEGSWFLVPAADTSGSLSLLIRFYPNGCTSHDEYREAWHLL